MGWFFDFSVSLTFGLKYDRVWILNDLWELTKFFTWR